MLYDKTGREKSKTASFKPETSLSQLKKRNLNGYIEVVGDHLLSNGTEVNIKQNRKLET